jgi:predicted transcriptional regulator
MTMAPIGIVKVSMTMAPIGIVKVSMTTDPVGIVKVNDNGHYRHSKSINDGIEDLMRGKS